MCWMWRWTGDCYTLVQISQSIGSKLCLLCVGYICESASIRRQTVSPTTVECKSNRVVITALKTFCAFSFIFRCTDSLVNIIEVTWGSFISTNNNPSGSLTMQDWDLSTAWQAYKLIAHIVSNSNWKFTRCIHVLILVLRISLNPKKFIL